MPLPSPQSDERAAAEPAAGLKDVVPDETASLPAQLSTPLPRPLPMPLSRFNAAPALEASALLMHCCSSRRLAVRIAACRPYPNMGALGAALDEASFDMTSQDLTEALEAESSQMLSPGRGPAPEVGQRGTLAAYTALRAAHAAYNARFGYPFLICLDSVDPAEWLDHELDSVRSRLGNDPEEELVVAAEELRRLARGRLIRMVAGRSGSRGAPG